MFAVKYDLSLTITVLKTKKCSTLKRTPGISLADLRYLNKDLIKMGTLTLSLLYHGAVSNKAAFNSIFLGSDRANNNMSAVDIIFHEKSILTVKRVIAMNSWAGIHRRSQICVLF